MKGNNSLFSKVASSKYKFKLNIQLFAKMPKTKAQIEHILADRPGHLKNKITSSLILERISSDEKNFVGIDSYGNKRYVKMIGKRQYWVSTRNDIIQNGGVNIVPRNRDELYDRNGGKRKWQILNLAYL